MDLRHERANVSIAGQMASNKVAAPRTNCTDNNNPLITIKITIATIFGSGMGSGWGLVRGV